MKISGTVAVVTGGASGIGRGIAEQLIAAGATVVIADLDAAALAQVASTIGADHCQVDVSDLASVRHLADRVIERHGAIHILCNNAGVGPMAPLGDMSIADWKWILGVNLWGVIHGLNVFLPLLKAHGGPAHIVNTGSMSSLLAAPGLGGYAATKYGVLAITETLSDELAAEGLPIHASILCPGPVKTNIAQNSSKRPAAIGTGALTGTELDDLPLFAGQPVPYITPAEVGDMVVRAIRDEALYIITHPQLMAPVVARHRLVEASAASTAT